MKDSIYYGLIIEHPHSGQISRTQLGTLLIHNEHTFNEATRQDRIKKAVEQIKGRGEKVVILKDENGKIKIAGTPGPLYENPQPER